MSGCERSVRAAVTEANGVPPARVGPEEPGPRSFCHGQKTLIIQLGIMKIASSTQVKRISSVASRSVLESVCEHKVHAFFKQGSRAELLACAEGHCWR